MSDQFIIDPEIHEKCPRLAPPFQSAELPIRRSGVHIPLTATAATNCGDKERDEPNRSLTEIGGCIRNGSRQRFDAIPEAVALAAWLAKILSQLPWVPPRKRCPLDFTEPKLSIEGLMPYPQRRRNGPSIGK